MTKTILQYRELFPTLNEKIQLSSCSQSALALPVIDAMEEYKESLIQNGMDWELWMNKVNESKHLFASLINADVDDIAIMSSVSECISSVLSSFPVNHGKNQIVTTELDFPCIGHAMQTNKESLGVNVTYIPSNKDYTISLEDYDKYLDTNTLLTSISHVSYYNGWKQNVKEIAALAHAKGSYLFVDAYQSIGNINIDVKDMNVDFLAAGAQKFMLGVPGIAFLYIKKELATKLTPKVTGWFSQSDPFSFDVKQNNYSLSSSRFDTGTPPVINAYVASAAMKLLLDIGVTEIQKYLENLSDFTIEYAKSRGFHVMSPQKSSEKGANTALYFAQAPLIEKLMKDKGIIVSARKDVIRIAPHFYNTKEDIRQAINELHSLVL
ncbi:aminotransferase class V-fold PLP-dependent enzyme [Bacillus sp. RO2]|uniref:aminotransferase class V-fold PLP-dependent enzyme n=1 Tax=Bacillus sp. RO2 TaxID=2723913 RepID=UPI00197BE852|nr:aminotransferase class V-fold PLP-dependent enzyme [Bacillus sp. RO2]